MGINLTNFITTDLGKQEQASESRSLNERSLQEPTSHWTTITEVISRPGTPTPVLCNYKPSRVFQKTTFCKLVIKKIKQQFCDFKMILLIAFLTVMDKDMTQIISMHILVKKSS